MCKLSLKAAILNYDEQIVNENLRWDEGKNNLINYLITKKIWQPDLRVETHSSELTKRI
jgi:hypothetical protein